MAQLFSFFSGSGCLPFSLCLDFSDKAHKFKEVHPHTQAHKGVQKKSYVLLKATVNVMSVSLLALSLWRSFSSLPFIKASGPLPCLTHKKTAHPVFLGSETQRALMSSQHPFTWHICENVLVNPSFLPHPSYFHLRSTFRESMYSSLPIGDRRVYAGYTLLCWLHTCALLHVAIHICVCR